MGKGKPKKRYGPVSRRGISHNALERIRSVRRKKDQAKAERNVTCQIPAGTVCQVRRLGAKDWRDYTTKREVVCKGYRWRNRTHWGFESEGFEIKIRVGLFRKEAALGHA